MSPRKNWNREVEARLQKYLQQYELDDLNQANDLASLRQMCALEISIEKNTKALLNIKDPAAESKKIKDLQTAIKDATSSYTNLQNELGINRRKRKGEGESYKDNARLYVEWLKEVAAPRLINSRLRVVECERCRMAIGQYKMWIWEDGEPGSMEAEKNPPKPYKYSVSFQCPKCKKMVTVSNIEGEENVEREA